MRPRYPVFVSRFAGNQASRALRVRILNPELAAYAATRGIVWLLCRHPNAGAPRALSRLDRRSRAGARQKIIELLAQLLALFRPRDNGAVRLRYLSDSLALHGTPGQTLP